ncbi:MULTISPECIES: TetR/AcrR family transcriptional regulator [unclassified Streptomyces]|uniref:TetR/AcrR family transcriptional regulator n=1 Tax=unclassified Streptomyces TaxID=2593676 RepID=UPI002256A6ED|nr:MULTISPECIES: TetR/AcrR family transcriptional regulator C-terminal domain-containing protein [unclassified Streptomyces]MCX5049740.1 TetR/AcrR family transcriptional regulator C-terminal domain-containing protein [Streptomyces sp. NBC_00474]
MTDSGTRTTKRAGRSRLPRGTLSQELIVQAAFRVADSSGMEKLTFQALGRELSAHPTAIYRHFRNKDELLLALIDALHEEALASIPPPTDDWAHDLMQIAIHTHEAFLRHPRVGALAAARTARRENEFRSVERKLDCMRRAGLDDAEAARYYRVFADLVLAYSAMDASLAALSPELRDADLGAWQTDYLTLPADKYPNIARFAPRFVGLDDPQNFVAAVQAVIDTVRAKTQDATRRS